MQVGQRDKIIGQQILNLNDVMSKPKSSHCGYCDKYGSYSWGLTSIQQQVMHPYTYQVLAERGWRRCGTYYYKPDIKNACCKLWTHRMDTNKFKIKKDQRKTVRQVADWLAEKTGDNKFKQAKDSKLQQQMKPQHKQKHKQQKNIKIIAQVPKKWQQLVIQSANYFTKIIQLNKTKFFALFGKKFTFESQTHEQFIYSFDVSKIKCFISQPSANSDFYSNYLMLLFGSNKATFKKQYNCVQFVKDIKQFLLQNMNRWGNEKGVCVDVQRGGYLLYTQYSSKKMEKKFKHEQQQKNKQMQMKEKINKNQKMQEKPAIKKQSRKSMTEQPKQKEEHKVKYELKISSQLLQFGPLKIMVVPAQVTSQSWKMYQRYCQQIHEKPQKSQSSYSNFLCQKALKFIKQQTNKPCQKTFASSWQQQPNHKLHPIQGKRTKYLGCYHMKYYIGKQLIGVGVVDILPDGLSSVYFFYQPKYKDFRLGVFSSIIQIQYTRWLSLSFPEFKNYYMGFYIQNSLKMNYKGNYEPFDLLCPVTYQFVQCTPELRHLIEKIQNRAVMAVQLANNNNKIDDMNFTTDIGVYISQNIKIKYQGKKLTLKDLNPKIMISVLGMLREMVQVWGKFIFQTFTFTF